MIARYKMVLIGALLFACISKQAQSQQTLAFPGAEGYGAYAQGGKGGEVFHVTNLADSGKGTFREAVSVPGRTVVFDVSGVIKIKDKIAVSPNTTISGQTAPGEGIVVYGNGVSFASNTIVQYMRFRGSINMSKGACTVVLDNLTDLIMDHCSIQWGRWDNLHIKGSSNITLQHCIIGEGIDPQRFGALFEDPKNITIHHCLWIDNQSRNPKAKAGIEYINNVVYNYGVNGFVGGHSAADHYQDIINNYFIAGPNSSTKFIGMFTATDHVYHSGNFADLDKDGVLNGRPVVDSDFVKASATLLPKRSNESPAGVKIEDAATAYANVVANAGASLKRDAVDLRLIGYLKSLGKSGEIFKTEEAAGGQAELNVDKKKSKKAKIKSQNLVDDAR
jgi:pectate lyase